MYVHTRERDIRPGFDGVETKCYYFYYNWSVTDLHTRRSHRPMSHLSYTFVSPILGVDSRDHKRTSLESQPRHCCLACVHEMAHSKGRSVFLQKP